MLDVSDDLLTDDIVEMLSLSHENIQSYDLLTDTNVRINIHKKKKKSNLLFDILISVRLISHVYIYTDGVSWGGAGERGVLLPGGIFRVVTCVSNRLIIIRSALIMILRMNIVLIIITKAWKIMLSFRRPSPSLILHWWNQQLQLFLYRPQY